MWPAGSIEEWRDFYRGGGQTGGLWSVLIARTPDQSADFANRYLHLFNGVVGRGWHLAVYASYSKAAGRSQWIPNQNLHNHIDALRALMVKSGDDLPELCAVFMNPSNVEFESRSVVIPFDPNRIGDADFYRKGFVQTHECIVRAFRHFGLDYNQTPPQDQIDNILQQFHAELTKSRIKAWITTAREKLADAALSFAVGAPFM